MCPSSGERGRHLFCWVSQKHLTLISGQSTSKSKSELSYDLQSVGRPVLVSDHNQGPWQIFLSPWNFVRQLRVSYFVALSLRKGWVCDLLLLLGLASSVHPESKYRGTQDHILYFQLLRLPEPGGTGLRIYIAQGHGGPVIPLGTGFPFRLLLRLAGLRWKYSYLPPHGLYPRQSQSQSHVTTDGRSVSQLVYRAHSGTCDQILLCVRKLLSCICGVSSMTTGQVCNLSFSIYRNLSVCTLRISVSCVSQFSIV
jgi:hypothetical protein